VTAVAPARGPLTFGLLISVFMISVDATMVNVALPMMQGELSASAEQITWVLTSFVVVQAMMIPISGWLAARFGAKPMLLLCVTAFTLVSVLCGIATSLPEMVLFRLLQGISGAPVSTLAQAVMLNVNPPERFGRAMALFTMSAVAGPVLGPVLGGYVTDQWSWRWCFYINVPAGLLALFLMWRFLPAEIRRPRRIDLLGFASLAIAIAAFQLMLDRGPTRDWFNSKEICVEAIVSAAALWVYLAHTLTAKTPLFNPTLARDRNFVVACLVTALFSVVLFGSVALVPLMTQGVLGYPVLLSGLVGMPRGVVVILVLQLMGRLDTLVDRRLMIGTGLAVLALSFWKMGHFSIMVTAELIVLCSMIQGVGHGLVSSPTSTAALAGLRAEHRADGSAIINLIRTLGGSLGIAGIQAVTVFNSQRMHEALAGHVRLDDPVVRAGLPAAVSPETVQGAVRLNEEITRQALMVAYVDDFRMLAAIALCTIPLLFLMRGRTPAAAAEPAPRHAPEPVGAEV
jgi:DHA2 family multidrug resistance protein